MDNRKRVQILQQIQEMLGEEAVSLRPLYGGNSLAIGYRLETLSGKKYSVKLTNRGETHSRFQLVGYLHQENAAVAKPILEFDLKDGINRCTVYEWIFGQTVKDYIAKGEEPIQVVKLAKSVCDAIKSIHKCAEWKPRQSRDQEIASYISFIQNREIIFPHKKDFLSYIQNTAIPSIRLPRCTHMDFHTRNIVIDSYGKAILIDYENMDISEPWRDFVYAASFHDGDENLFWILVIGFYFDFSVPDNFWSIVKYYSIIQLLRMVICGFQKGTSLLGETLSESLFSTYDRLRATVPKWGEKYLRHMDQIRRLAQEHIP